ncbi:MAG: rod shape-determining protein RodA [Candidatus Puniceispirillum sp. TMED52]|nr:rod shape-determining protein RodA [SAR116 cluster bacterium]OUU42750.1 MAG: rod shape-determining protein RodA [Candidatus Puniceispirillum sp. TMED52]
MKQIIRPRHKPTFSTPLHSQNSGDRHWFWTTPWLMILIIGLIGIVGVLALYSAAHGAWRPWAMMHSIRIGIGFILMLVVAMFPIDFIRKYALLWWVGAVILLAILEVLGTGNGVQRWFSVGGFNLQPSEPAKLAVIVMLAAYFHDIYSESMRYLRTYIPVIAIVGIPFIQVLLQPDLGTSLMLVLSAAVLVFVAGIPRWMVVSTIGLIMAAVPIGWSMLYPYQKSRIMVFLNPDLDALGAGYQVTQSKIALGSGGGVGKGYLQGSQSHLEFLPERQTDFIFTMIGEEFGFFGCLYVIGLYSGLIFLLLKYSFSVGTTFSRLLIIGVAAMISFYVTVNIGMVSGILPVVGAPLPLISYGGTAMLTVFLGLGLVISAMRNDKEIKD